MKQIHEIQRQILGKLQFADRLHFSEMKPDQELGNNQFDFHLKQLVKQEFVIKKESHYLLTDIGKKYIAELDTKEKKIATGAMNVVWLVCSKWERNDRYLLIYTRKKQPFFGCQGFPAGKIKLGESVEESAIRELKEEANLSGEPVIKALLHFRTYSKTTSELVQDMFMYLCHFVDPVGEIVNSYEGEYEWVKEEELFEVLKKPFSSIDDYKFALELLDETNDRILFKEKVEFTDDF